MNSSRGLGPINLGHLHTMENHRHFLVGAGQRFDLLSHARPLPAAVVCRSHAELFRRARSLHGNDGDFVRSSPHRDALLANRPSINLR
jgi:hypothetical protein